MMKTSFSLSLIGIFFTTTAAYALPFNIVPIGTLPTTINAGGTAAASYSITNLTNFNPPSNLVKWLPPNVSINPLGTTCTPTSAFPLAPGQNCTLNLTVSGPVNKNDPNPHHHLFVCMSDKATCAGPSPLNSLNVTQVAPAFYAAVGQYVDYDQPGVATSPDGKTWTKQTLIPPDSFLYGALYGVSCLGQLCVAAGAYSNIASLSNDIPGIAVSTNAGTTWSQQAFTNLPTSPAVMTSGQLNGSNCTAQGCVAVGYFTAASSNEYAAIYTSTNHTNWLAQALPLPANITQVNLNGINCDTGICVAVGNFLDSTDSTQHPGIAVSTDRTAWNQLELPLPANFTQDANLNGVSCIQNSCIAVGNFTNTSSSNSFPGIAVSSDNAKTTWTEQVLSTLPSPPSITLVQGELIGVSCTTSYCVAVGDYTDTSFNNYPAIAISTDSQHMTWSQTALTSLPSFLGTPMVQGAFSSVTCSGSICIAVGVYIDNTDIAYPGVAYSADKGQTWTQQVLPTFGDDQFNGVN